MSPRPSNPPLPPLPPGAVIVFAPEPAGWLPRLRAQLGDRAIIWAPWSRPAPPRLSRPRALAAPLARRVLPDARRVPGFDLLDAALTRLGADRPTLQYPLAHHRRVALGHLAARALPRRPAAVIAPCFAAAPFFAAARDRGARTMLVHDWPDLAALHADLDAAAARHPDDPWLKRFRPPARWIAEQRSERHLADHIIVQSRYAAGRITADGIPAARLALPTVPHAAPIPRAGRQILLIGRGAARGGAHEALALLDRRPDLRLVGRLGTAALPTLRSHPRFTAVDAIPWPDIAAALAPGWVEACPSAVVEAAARGVPIIATDRAAGSLPAERYRPIEPGDVDAMLSALADA